MQQEDDTDDFGEHHDDVIGLARKGHTEENAEDIERQYRNDNCLNGLFDDGAELREAFLRVMLRAFIYSFLCNAISFLTGLLVQLLLVLLHNNQSINPIKTIVLCCY